MPTEMHEFSKDNEIGKRGEAVVAEHLSNRGYAIEDVSSDRRYQADDIDLIVHTAEGDVTLEVKNDTWIAKSGNVFFETVSNRHFSTVGCFEKSKADFLAIVSESERRIYFMRTATLRDYVQGHRDSLGYREVKGSNSCGYLVPVKDIRDQVSIVRY